MADELVPKLQAYIRAKDPQGSAGLEAHDYVVRFSSLGAPQELRIKYVPPNSWTLSYVARLPDARERWFVESKWVWFPEHSGGKRVKLAPLDDRYKLFASDEGFFRSTFQAKELSDALMQLPAENHFKAALKDSTLTAAWIVRFNPRLNDRDGLLLQCADVLVFLGAQLFKHAQLSTLMRGGA